MKLECRRLLLCIIFSTINAIRYHHHAWRRKNQNLRQLFFPRSKNKQSTSSKFKLIWNVPTMKDCEIVFKNDYKYEFNHNFVGITNPLQDIISTSVSSPCTSTIDNEHSMDKYRIIRYKKIIGKGDETYERLKHAILHWSPTLPSNNWAGIQILKPKHILREDIIENNNANVQQIWNNRKRRLVTFSRVFGKLWCFNPCCVIYDIIDQSDHDWLYTSTAYATLKGHFLCGEERVTVGIKRNTRSMPILQASNSMSCGITQLNDDGDVFVEILSCSAPSSTIFGNLVFRVVKNMQLRFFRQQLDTLEEIAQNHL